MTIRKFVSSFLHRFGKHIPDPIYIRLQYYAYMGYYPDLAAPRTFNEKLQWLKLNNRNPLYTRLVDKTTVKDWVSEKIGHQYVIPTYEIWNTPEDMDFSALPEKFVLKCNHAGGNNGVFIITDKTKVNLPDIRARLAKTLKQSVYDHYREWPYKNVKKRIFAEKYLGESIDDFKFFCYDGFVESVMYCTERNTGNTKFYFFDSDWNLKRYNIRGKEAPEDFTIAPPKNYKRMFEIASILSKGFPFVRVDLYNIDGDIFFGEMTFFPASGLDPNLLPETDNYFGSLINLPEKQ